MLARDHQLFLFVYLLLAAIPLGSCKPGDRDSSKLEAAYDDSNLVLRSSSLAGKSERIYLEVCQLASQSGEVLKDSCIPALFTSSKRPVVLSSKDIMTLLSEEDLALLQVLKAAEVKMVTLHSREVRRSQIQSGVKAGLWVAGGAGADTLADEIGDYLNAKGMDRWIKKKLMEKGHKQAAERLSVLMGRMRYPVFIAIFVIPVIMGSKHVMDMKNIEKHRQVADYKIQSLKDEIQNTFDFAPVNIQTASKRGYKDLSQLTASISSVLSLDGSNLVKVNSVPSLLQDMGTYMKVVFKGEEFEPAQFCVFDTPKHRLFQRSSAKSASSQAIRCQRL